MRDHQLFKLLRQTQQARVCIVDGFAQLQNDGGIDHVLAGRAEMHVSGGDLVGLGDPTCQLLH